MKTEEMTFTFFGMEGKSARGMDFSVSGDRLELRMTNFSNEGDYFVTGVLAKLFLKAIYLLG